VLFLKPVPVHWLVLAGALAGLALWSAGLPIAG
jgi:hypothetical protein